MMQHFAYLGKKIVKNKTEMMDSDDEEERKPELTDSVFRWSINDIMNKDLYRNKV